MKIKDLRNKLPGVDVRREGRKVVFRGQGLTYSVDGRDKSRSESQLAETIRSKIPVAAILPPR